MRRRHLGYARGRGIWRQFSIDLERLDQDEELAVIWLYAEQVDLLRRHFVGPFAGFAEADSATILRRVIRENLFSLQPHLRQRVAEFERAAFRRPTVGVHVRYTDYRARLGAILPGAWPGCSGASRVRCSWRPTTSASSACSRRSFRR